MENRLKNILNDFTTGKRHINDNERTKTTSERDTPPTIFNEIAEAILNGHFEITSSNKVAKVFPTCVELYYHEEDGALKDPIVYHRNTKSTKKELFPVGTLHNHGSGIDITFEHQKDIIGTVRASALIREFRIETDNDVTVWGIDKSNDTHPTHLYAALFSQFNIFDGFNIKWADNKIVNNAKVIHSPRINVMQYDENGRKLKSQKDSRCWQFRLGE